MDSAEACSTQAHSSGEDLVGPYTLINISNQVHLLAAAQSMFPQLHEERAPRSALGARCERRFSQNITHLPRNHGLPPPLPFVAIPLLAREGARAGPRARLEQSNFPPRLAENERAVR
jgi:hypothetical protein